MEPSSFDTVLSAAKVGAEWAWERLYGELNAPLLGYARARGASDLADVVGDVFLELARNVGSFEGGWPAFKGWSFLIASHRVIDQHRRCSRRPEELCGQLPEVATRDVTAEAAEGALGSARAVELLAQLSPTSARCCSCGSSATCPSTRWRASPGAVSPGSKHSSVEDSVRSNGFCCSRRYRDDGLGRF